MEIFDLSDGDPLALAAKLERQRRERQGTDNVRAPFPITGQLRRRERLAVLKDVGVAAGLAVVIMVLLIVTSGAW